MQDTTFYWMDGVFFRAEQLLGREAQEIKAIEELAELTQAIIKNQQRHKNDNHQSNLLEEIADVEIMLLQLKRFNRFKQSDIDAIKFEKVKALDALIDKKIAEANERAIDDGRDGTEGMVSKYSKVRPDLPIQ